MNRAEHHKEYKGNWETPPKEFLITDEVFDHRFYLDVAASEKNTKCPFFITEQEDALEKEWNARQYFKNAIWWCNPDFRLAEKFLKHAHDQLALGHEGIMLVPNNAETVWFRTYITHENMPRLIWPSRIKFIDPPEREEPGDGNTGASVLVAFVKPDFYLPPILGEPWIGNI